MRTLLLLLALGLAACAEPADTPRVPDSTTTGTTSTEEGHEDVPDASASPAASAEAAAATLEPAGTDDVRGRVHFTRFDGGVRVTALVSGLPKGEYGLTVHSGTRCAEPGPHFNPDRTRHGAPYNDADARHAGDLGNIRADGMARYDRMDHILRLDGPASAVGRAVAIHAEQDDFNTDPDGGLGTVLACGIIEATR